MGFLESFRRRGQSACDEKMDKEIKHLVYQVRVLSAHVDKLTNTVDKLELKADAFVDASALEEVREQVSKNRQSVRTLRERFERYIHHK